MIDQLHQLLVFRLALTSSNKLIFNHHNHEDQRSILTFPKNLILLIPPIRKNCKSHMREGFLACNFFFKNMLLICLELDCGRMVVHFISEVFIFFSSSN